MKTSKYALQFSSEKSPENQKIEWRSSRARFPSIWIAVK